jgi:hypothetical protein
MVIWWKSPRDGIKEAGKFYTEKYGSRDSPRSPRTEYKSQGDLTFRQELVFRISRLLKRLCSREVLLENLDILLQILVPRFLALDPQYNVRLGAFGNSLGNRPGGIKLRDIIILRNLN